MFGARARKFERPPAGEKPIANSRVTSPAPATPAVYPSLCYRGPRDAGGIPESLLPRAPPPSRAPQCTTTTDEHRARICFIATRLCTLCFYNIFFLALAHTRAHTAHAQYTRAHTHTRSRARSCNHRTRTHYALTAHTFSSPSPRARFFVFSSSFFLRADRFDPLHGLQSRR